MSLPNELSSKVYKYQKMIIVSKLRMQSKSLNNILENVSEVIGFHPDLLKGKLRKRELVDGRGAFAIIAKKKNPLTSYEAIGNVIDRDHSTITHYLKNLSEIKEVKEIIKKAYEKQI